jgi:hypothetical protein
VVSNTALCSPIKDTRNLAKDETGDGGVETTRTAVGTAPRHLERRLQQPCSGSHLSVSHCGSFTLHLSLGHRVPQALVQLEFTDQAGAAVVVDGEEAKSPMMTHHHHTTILDPARTNRTMDRLSKDGVQASGLARLVELLLDGLRTAWVTGAIRPAVVVDGAMVAVVDGTTAAREAHDRRLDRASPAHDMRAQVLARLRDDRCRLMMYSLGQE